MCSLLFIVFNVLSLFLCVCVTAKITDEENAEHTVVLLVREVCVINLDGESSLTETMGIRRLLPNKLFRLGYVLQAT